MSIDRSENRPAIPSGSRMAREGRIKADSRILDQLREPGTPGHRDFTREGRTAPTRPVIGRPNLGAFPDVARAVVRRVMSAS